MLFAFIPFGAKSASAAKIVAGLPVLVVTDGTHVGTLVGFAGEEWYIVGDGTTGIFTDAPGKNITLLITGSHPEGDDSSKWTYDWSIYGPTVFRETWHFLDSSNKPSDMSLFTQFLDSYWYKNNLGENPGWAEPNEYFGSALLQRMEEIAAEYAALSPREYYLINVRTLTPTADVRPNGCVDYRMLGADVANQKLWPLSYFEWVTIGNSNVRKYTAPYWLRSASTQRPVPYALMAFAPGSTWNALQLGPSGFAGYLSSMTARPALNLNLDNALFTSEASANGKPAANLGDGLIAATPTSGSKVKFTIIDFDTSFLNLNVPDLSPRVAAPGGTISVDYDGAIIGADKYVSCVITDENDNVLFYGKLNDAADGAANIELPSDMPIGSYKVKLFNEQVNGDNYTDFSSDPIVIPLTVRLAPVEHELTFVTNGGSALDSLLIPDGEVHELTEKPTRPDYNFVGWYADEKLEVAISDVTMDGDKTVYAAWEKIEVNTPEFPNPPAKPEPSPIPSPSPEEPQEPTPKPDESPEPSQVPEEPQEPSPEPDESPEPPIAPEQTPEYAPPAEQPPLPMIPGDTIVPGDDEDSYIELGEDGTPHGEWHKTENGNWVFVEYIPPVAEVPKTGDEGVALCLPLMLGGAALLGIAALTGKKKYGFKQ
jgi:uncharacterized repeat protein (TIGR02543 family)